MLNNVGNTFLNQYISNDKYVKICNQNNILPMYSYSQRRYLFLVLEGVTEREFVSNQIWNTHVLSRQLCKMKPVPSFDRITVVYSLLLR